MTSPTPGWQDAIPRSIPGGSATSQRETDARICQNLGQSGLKSRERTLGTGPDTLPVSTASFQIPLLPGCHPTASSRSSLPALHSPYQRLWRHLLDTCSLRPSKRKKQRCQRELTKAVPLPWGDWDLKPMPTPLPSTQPSGPKPSTPPLRGTFQPPACPPPGKLPSTRVAPIDRSLLQPPHNTPLHSPSKFLLISSHLSPPAWCEVRFI